jgi:putative tricarboxylic transport membrane protein
MLLNRIIGLFSRCSLAAISLSLLVPGPALALDNLKILAAGATGGGWDQTARALQSALQSNNIVPKVTVDNKGGAGGTIALAQFVNNSKGDGNALLVAGNTMLGAILVNKSPVNVDQVTPIARLAGEYDVVVVHPSSKIQSIKDLQAQLKANPGSVSWGGGSVGGADHMLAGMIAQATGVDPGKINYIAYAGGGEVTASILGGHVTAAVSGLSELAAQIKSGKLRALGISSPQRLAGVDIPTLKEQGLDVEMANWRAVFGGPGITDAQRKELIDAVGRAVKTPKWQEAVKAKEWTDMYLAGDQFKAFLEAEQAQTQKLVASLGLVKK